MWAKVCLNTSLRLHAAKTNMICKGQAYKCRPPRSTGEGNVTVISLFTAQQQGPLALYEMLPAGHHALVHHRFLTTKVPSDASTSQSKDPSTADKNSTKTAAANNINTNGVRDRILEKMTTGHVGQLVSAFEEFLGISDVRRAQAKLVQVGIIIMWSCCLF